jgi:serine/threonine-protein kinase
LQRPVAIKVLRSEFSRNERFVQSFRREGQLLAHVNSPRVVHVYAAGVHQEKLWIAMEYMSGGDIARWVGGHGTPPPKLAARWLRDALTGMRYIHRNVGIVHGDLKPHNLLLDAARNLKIGDLGLSRLEGLARQVEADGTIRGTLWYMSPEQARGESTDARSDLFSLGSTFYHILSGTRPYDASTPAEIITRIAQGEFAPLSEVAPYAPAALVVLVERLMQPDPLRRYQDAAVALADLESYLEKDRLAPAEFVRTELSDMPTAKLGRT